MGKDQSKKSLVIGIVIMFIGVSIVPNIFGYQQKLDEKQTNMMLPSEVWVDDDFNESTPGWGYDHFDDIQNGTDHVTDNGIIYVFNGIYDNNGWGISIEARNNLTFIGENKNNTILDAEGYGSGFFIKNCENLTIYNITINNTGSLADHEGIRIINSQYCDIVNCVIQNCKAWGISIEESQHNKIMNCKINNCSLDGIIICLKSVYNEIIGSTINLTRRVSIAQNSSYNNVINNIISNNRETGLAIAANSYYNLIYNNNFIKNKFKFLNLNAIDLCGKNKWDNGSVGNYWSSTLVVKFPRLFDRNEDEIADNISHWILFFGLDHFPKTKPNNIAQNILNSNHIYPIDDNKNLFQNTIQYRTNFRNIIYVSWNSPPPGNGTIEWPYSKIQYAIDNASNGDIIRVYNGTYRENVIVNKKLSLEGNESSGTIINGMGKISVQITGGNSNLSEFTITNGSTGIKISSDSNIITENKIPLNKGNGIWIFGAHNNINSNNTIIKNENDGIWLVNSDNNSIVNNIITKNDWAAMIFETSSYNNVSNNEITDNNASGIFMQSSYNNQFISNNISNNGYLSPKWPGILINFQSTNNTIFHNYISFNGGRGIYITNNSNDNLIYNNYLILNGIWLLRQNAFDDSNNLWDNGYNPEWPENQDPWNNNETWGGNHWSDNWFGNIDQFKGPDQNVPGRDGIADNHYKILGGNNTDRYPIIYGNESTPPVVTIKNPEPGWIYIAGKRIGNTEIQFLKKRNITIILGPCLIQVHCEDESGMQGVNFYWDTILDVPDASDQAKQPYQTEFSGLLTKTKIGRHSLYVEAVDIWGNKTPAIPVPLTIWVFNLYFPEIPSLNR